jgi:hypothetical protein
MRQAKEREREERERERRMNEAADQLEVVSSDGYTTRHDERKRIASSLRNNNSARHG